ncbi:hypothetical protein R6Q57_010002 [Mikania cordata]
MFYYKKEVSLWYSGTFPKFDHCKHHYVANQLCKQCTTCRIMGHESQNCRTLTTQRLDSAEPTYLPPRNIKGCYTCGEPGHEAKKSPKGV